MESSDELRAAAESPRALGYRLPAEWEPHASVWLAWPSHPGLWGSLLPEVQRELVALCRAIADPAEDGRTRGEAIELLVPDEARHGEARAALADLDVRLHRVPFGDIWLRDTGPVFVADAGGVAAVCFRFNGWAERYVLPGDAELAGRLADLVGGARFDCDLVLEGGAIETDGEGTLLTTRQCLLHPRRNPGLSAAEIEVRLADALGAPRILWLARGLRNDHTDGHVDTLVRFVAPGRVVCMEARARDDPNREVLREIADSLAAFRDRSGRRLQIERVPSPGLLHEAETGMPLPASYVNYYVGNTTVVVPTYGSPYDDEAVESIAALFPGRRTVGCSARAILEGGGAFHCVTQQQPRRRVA